MKPIGLYTVMELKSLFLNYLTLYDIAIIYMFVFVIYKVSERYLYLRRTTKEQSMVNRFFLFVAVIIYLTTTLKTVINLSNLNLFELTTISILFLILFVQIVNKLLNKANKNLNKKSEKCIENIIKTPQDKYIEKEVLKHPALSNQGLSEAMVKAIEQLIQDPLGGNMWRNANVYSPNAIYSREYFNMQNSNTIKIESVDMPKSTKANIPTDLVLYIIIIVALFKSQVTEITVTNILIIILLLLFIKHYIIDININNFVEIFTYKTKNKSIIKTLKNKINNKYL